MHGDNSLRTNGAEKNLGGGLKVFYDEFLVPGGTFHLIFESTIKLNLSMREWFLLEILLTPYWF